MLVLSRQRDETIMIGDDIEITIVDIRGDKVRLGITAPNRIAVHRKEVYESITRENRQAATIAHGDLETMGGISPGPTRLRENASPSGLSRLSPIAVGNVLPFVGAATPGVFRPLSSRSIADPPGSVDRSVRGGSLPGSSP